jgi:cystine transport system ATP-binding protein
MKLRDRWRPEGSPGDLRRDLARDGWTTVVVTHELQFRARVAHQVAFVDAGAILEYGPPDQVLRKPENDRTRQSVRRLLHTQ